MSLSCHSLTLFSCSLLLCENILYTPRILHTHKKYSEWCVSFPQQHSRVREKLYMHKTFSVNTFSWYNLRNSNSNVIHVWNQFSSFTFFLQFFLFARKSFSSFVCDSLFTTAFTCRIYNISYFTFFSLSSFSFFGIKLNILCL